VGHLGKSREGKLVNDSVARDSSRTYLVCMASVSVIGQLWRINAGSLKVGKKVEDSPASAANVAINWKQTD
jgi:hypothetical protein